MRKIQRMGVSTIISNLIILSIVAVLGTAVFAFTVTGYSTYQNQMGLYLSSRADAVSEQVIIEHAWFNDTDNDGLYDQAKIYIRNIGEAAVNIDTIYIDSLAESEVSSTSPLSLGLDQVGELTIAMNNEVAAGTVIFVEAVSGEGNVFTAYFEVG